MSTYNERKEPTFGTPAKGDLTENSPKNTAETAPKKAKVAFSLHTNTAPSYSFTPIMKPSQTSNTEERTAQEQVAPQTAATTQPAQQTDKPAIEPKANGGFTFSPVAEEITNEPEVEAEKSDNAPNVMERVIPAAAPTAAKATVEKVPSKYRRLLIVLSLLLLLLLVFFLLKPKAPESVEALQQQGSSLPIEFRPVDEEEAKRAEAQAKALQEQMQKQQTQTVEQQGDSSTENLATQTVPENTQAGSVEPAQPNPTTQVQEQSMPVVAKPSTPQIVEAKTLVQEPVKKPTTSGSVIYQPENVSKAAPVVKTTPQPKTTVKAQPQSKVESTKPAQTTSTSQTSAIVASKTLTVPKGVSLMQVFRDNNLNISDVNAMSKVNNIVSNLKVGEKVVVRLDKNNRVIEMDINAKGKFIRQANGAYIYK